MISKGETMKIMQKCLQFAQLYGRGLKHTAGKQMWRERDCSGTDSDSERVKRSKTVVKLFLMTMYHCTCMTLNVTLIVLMQGKNT